MLILHLEDEGPLSEIMRIVLTTAEPQLDLRQFEDSNSAVEFITSHISEVDLFVLDVRVPGELDGMDFARKVRELGSKRPIIITSAYRRPDRKMLEELECVWMAKPWHIIDAPQIILPLAKRA